MTEADGGAGPKPTPRLVIRPDPQDELGIYCLWIGSGGNYTLHWGDGTSDPMTWQAPPKNHVYAAAGRYQVRAVAVHNPEHSGSAWIDVPLIPPGPKVEFRGGALTVGVRWPSSLLGGTWRVYWPYWDPEDFVPEPEVWYERPALPGHPTMQVVHLGTGTTADSKPLAVTDLAWAVTADIETSGRTVEVVRTAPQLEPERPWHVYWGDEWTLDGGLARRATPLVDDRATHTYADSGTYVIEISSTYRSRVYAGVFEVTV